MSKHKPFVSYTLRRGVNVERLLGAESTADEDLLWIIRQSGIRFFDKQGKGLSDNQVLNYVIKDRDNRRETQDHG